MMSRMRVIRLITVEDATALADLLRVSREFLAPWQPIRPDEFFTTNGQQKAINDALHDHERGATAPYAILDGGGIVGRVTLTNIVRGPFQSCVQSRLLGRLSAWRPWLGTAAVREIVEMAFGRIGLHRVEAGTLTHNIGSQRVLERNGLVRFGMAPAYLKIAGRWQDHVLYQAVNHAMP